MRKPAALDPAPPPSRQAALADESALRTYMQRVLTPARGRVDGIVHAWRAVTGDLELAGEITAEHFFRIGLQVLDAAGAETSPAALASILDQLRIEEIENGPAPGRIVPLEFAAWAK